MSQLSNLVKVFDIYGSNFNLRINNQSKFKSVTGGLLSLITMGVLVFCIVTFGRQFYLRLNPFISIEEGIYMGGSDTPFLMNNSYQENNVIFFSIDKQYDLRYKPYFMIKSPDGKTKLQLIDYCQVGFLEELQIITAKNKETEFAHFQFYCFTTNNFNFSLSSFNEDYGLYMLFGDCKLYLQTNLMQKILLVTLHWI